MGNPSWIFRKWLEHPTPDGYWNGTAPTPADYARLTIPIFTRTGMYDGDQLGALTYYRRHMQYGNPEAKAKHYLVIGPWDHAGTRTPKRTVGGLSFGDASMMKLEELEQGWYDWTMKGGSRPAFVKKG